MFQQKFLRLQSLKIQIWQIYSEEGSVLEMIRSLLVASRLFNG